jgi:hypothetical protein
MRKIFGLLLIAALALSVVPGVFAVSVGSGVGVDISTEEFVPRVWLCDNRVVLDDATEPGRISGDGEELIERINNYAFEGEQIQWSVLVLDKNKIDQNIDVYATVGDVQGTGNDIEVNCFRDEIDTDLCNARIDEEEIDADEAIADGIADTFTCILTVETPNSMHGEYWITVEAQDADGNMGSFDENEYWFLNPEIALSIDGDISFDNVRPGTSSYSDTLLLGNDAEAGSGVMLDMFISGTDFYDSSSSGARCNNPGYTGVLGTVAGQMTNQLTLANFRYFATNGAYSSYDDALVGRQDLPAGPNQPFRSVDPDGEGYINIGYGIGFNNPDPFYDGFEVLQAVPVGPYWVANVLAPGAEMALTFRLNLPEPCTGNFDSGSIFFWGEAI